MSDNGLLGWAEVLTPAFVAGLSAYVAVKIETAILKTRLDQVEDRITSLNNVMERLADFNGTLKLLDSRLMAQGERIDEVARIQREIIIERLGYGKTRAHPHSD